MISKGGGDGPESGRSWRTSESSGCLRAVVDGDQWSHSLLDLSPFSPVGSKLRRLMRDYWAFIRWSSSPGVEVRGGL